MVNPLRSALAHYETELVDILERGGATVDAIGTAEPSSGSTSRVGWLREYARLLRSADPKRHDRVISCWPALGYLDLVAIRGLSPVDSAVILHDPEPMVRARGYGVASRRLAEFASQPTEVIVHSRAAVHALARDAPRLKPVLLPHPLHTTETRAARTNGAQRTVSVLGQFKPDRDVDGLARLAEQAPPHWQLSIHGRGWPEVAGWDVESAFLSEDDFVRRIEGSDVVLIPYKKFFQSGVAIRCLETGTPCVGPRDSSLRDVFGDVPWLVEENDWLGAVERALHADPAEIPAIGAAVHDDAVTRWREWLG